MAWFNPVTLLVFQFQAQVSCSLFSLIVMASEEEDDLVTTEMGSLPLQKKNSVAGSLDQIPSRIGNSLSPEPSSNKADSQDSKSESLLLLLRHLWSIVHDICNSVSLLFICLIAQIWTLLLQVLLARKRYSNGFLFVCLCWCRNVQAFITNKTAVHIKNVEETLCISRACIFAIKMEVGPIKYTAFSISCVHCWSNSSTIYIFSIGLFIF